jgi:peroxiredoxin Q/BCP
MDKKSIATLNHSVPDFTLAATGGKSISLSNLQANHKYIVIYFYPKDCTSGCTLEGQQFRDLYTEFKKINAEILGVSRDTVTLHEKFKSQENFPFELLSDNEQLLCNFFDVIKEKNMYGKKVKGIQRSTFIIDHNSILKHEWRNVKPDGHANEVLETLKNLRGNK